MKVFGQLEKAQAENTTSDTGSLPKGTMTYRTDLNQMKVSDGTNMQTLMDLATAQTATNKTLTAPVLTTPTVDVPLFDGQGSSPAAPASGYYKMYFKDSDGKPYYKNSTGTEVAFGSGSGSGINYITAPDADTDIGTWTTYDDAAAAPVDGTAGTVTTTWTRTTSSPLRKDGSFLLTKDAANRQGEGAAFDITIHDADKGQVLAVSFDYAIASGTYADDDLTVYVIEDPSGTPVVKQLVPYKIKNMTTGLAAPWQGTFQTSTSVSTYRICIHVASTSASAYTVKFDNFYCGPQLKSFGPFISDWVSYTPTFTGFGTVSSSSVRYRRVGDSLEISAYWVNGTPTGVNASVTLPSGLSIDSSKVAQTTALGYYTRNLADTSSIEYQVLAPSGGNVLNFGRRTASAAPYTVALGNAISDAAGISSFNAIVPIAGWSSGMQLSSDAGDSRVVAASYATNSGTVNTATYTIIDYATKNYDTHSAVTTGASWKFTPPVAGYYRVNASVMFNSGGGWTSGEVARLGLFKNGSLFHYLSNQEQTSTHGNIVHLVGTSAVYLTTSDYIDIQAYQNSGGSLTLNASTQSNYLSIERISTGNQQIAASETVAAKYKTTAAQSIASSSATERIDYATKVFDTHNAVTTGASWVFTAPISGTYFVQACTEAGSSGGWAANEGWYTVIHESAGGTNYSHAWKAQSAVTAAASSSSVALVKLLAGQTVYVRVYQDNGSAISLSTDGSANYVSIIRVGNY